MVDDSSGVSATDSFIYETEIYSLWKANALRRTVSVNFCFVVIVPKQQFTLFDMAGNFTRLKDIFYLFLCYNYCFSNYHLQRFI